MLAGALALASIGVASVIISKLKNGKVISIKDLELNKGIAKKRTKRGFFSDGKMSFLELPDGTETSWHLNGKKSSEYLPDGTSRIWTENGNAVK